MYVQSVFSNLSKHYLLQLIIWPIERIFRLLNCGELAMYLFGGIAICGGMGIIFSLFSDDFNFAGKAVLSAMIVFAPSIVGTSLFDLVFMLCRKKNTIPTYVAAWLIVLSLVLLLFVAVAYFKHGDNPCWAYSIWGLSLLYWVIVNADDPKFSPGDNPNTVEGGEPMRRMSGKDFIEGVKS